MLWITLADAWQKGDVKVKLDWDEVCLYYWRCVNFESQQYGTSIELKQSPHGTLVKETPEEIEAIVEKARANRPIEEVIRAQVIEAKSEDLIVVEAIYGLITPESLTKLQDDLRRFGFKNSISIAESPGREHLKFTVIKKGE